VGNSIFWVIPFFERAPYKQQAVENHSIKQLWTTAAANFFSRLAGVRLVD
jgi:hypothetical protein